MHACLLELGDLIVGSQQLLLTWTCIVEGRPVLHAGNMIRQGGLCGPGLLPSRGCTRLRSSEGDPGVTKLYEI